MTGLEYKIFEKAKNSFLKLNIEEQHSLVLDFLRNIYMEENEIDKDDFNQHEFTNYLFKNNFVEKVDKPGETCYIKVNTEEIEKKFNDSFANIVILYIFTKLKIDLINYFRNEGKEIFQQMILADIYIKYGDNDLLKKKLTKHREAITDCEADEMLEKVQMIFMEKNLSDIIDLSEENLEILNINHRKLILNCLIYCTNSFLGIDINLIEAEEFFTAVFEGVEINEYKSVQKYPR